MLMHKLSAVANLPVTQYNLQEYKIQNTRYRISNLTALRCEVRNTL